MSSWVLSACTAWSASACSAGACGDSVLTVGSPRPRRSAGGSSAVETVEPVSVLACVERVPARELQCEPVVHLVAEQRLLAPDAAPADREHARTVGDLRFDPAD